jgi:hypothetical protein
MVLQSPVKHIPYAPWMMHTPLHTTFLVQPSLKHTLFIPSVFDQTDAKVGSSLQLLMQALLWVAVFAGVQTAPPNGEDDAYLGYYSPIPGAVTALSF